MVLGTAAKDASLHTWQRRCGATLPLNRHMGLYNAHPRGNQDRIKTQVSFLSGFLVFFFEGDYFLSHCIPC